MLHVGRPDAGGVDHHAGVVHASVGVLQPGDHRGCVEAGRLAAHRRAAQVAGCGAPPVRRLIVAIASYSATDDGELLR